MKFLQEIKLICIFLASNPKVLVPLVVAGIAQAAKGFGLSIGDEAQLNNIENGISILFGIAGLYFSFKAQWPNPPAQAPDVNALKAPPADPAAQQNQGQK
jgi:hypothetical protein